jgi:hypothetical protein
VSTPQRLTAADSFVSFRVAVDTSDIARQFRLLGLQMARLTGQFVRLDRRHRIIANQVQPMAIDGHDLHRRYRSRQGRR